MPGEDTQNKTQISEGTEASRVFSYRKWNRIRQDIMASQDILPGESMRVYALSAILLALFGGFAYLTPHMPLQKMAAVAVPQTEKNEERSVKPVPTPIDTFASVRLEAEEAYVYDTKTGKVLFEKNSDKQWPLASITKVMTALVAYEQLSPNTNIQITSEAIKPEGDGGFSLGSHFSFNDLLRITLVGSINDGAAALALATEATSSGATFIDLMNKKADELGLTETYFTNETGLDEGPNVSGGYGSAKDIARLFSYIIENHPDVLAESTEESARATSLEGQTVQVTNTNKGLRSIPFIRTSKTGFTDLAGGNLAVSFDLDFGHPIVVVVLGSTEDGRFKDVATLADAARRSFTQIQE